MAITGLVNGTTYEVQVQAVNAVDEGPWSDSATGTPVTTPGKVATPTLTAGDGSLTATWDAPADGGSPISSYRVRYRRSNTLSWTLVQWNSTRSMAITGLVNGTTYEVRVRAINTKGGGPWSDSATGTPRAKLATPSGLDVVPMPLRKARLSWTKVLNADGYVVEARDPDIGNPHESWNNWNSVSATTTCDQSSCGVDVELDSVILQRGLAHADAYEFRIRASDSGNNYLRSDFSETITIIDNPIVTGGSANGRSTGSGGQATLEWSKIADAKHYIVRYRKLGNRHWLISHSHLLWPGHKNWPYYPQSFSTAPTVAQPGSGPAVSTLVSGLDMGDLYAFQVNYRTTGGALVYSARDAYVWPSDSLPRTSTLLGHRVGTYPFFGYWKDGRYDYTVCDTTFPPEYSAGWEGLIETAFEQWEEAAPGLLTVTRAPGDCTSNGEPIDNDKPITLIKAMYNGSNEVYMVDTPNWGWRDWASALRHNRFFLCIIKGKACVISTRYKSLGYHRLLDEVMPLDEGSVDVLVNEAKVTTTLHVPETGKVRFNECRVPGKSISNYELMIHESGHALGMSGYELEDLVTSGGHYMAHPAIPDSVMNSEGRYKIKYPVGSGFSEPDCSPHPFDVMAVYALYQMAPRVVISGPASGRELDSIALVAQASGGTPPYSYEWSSRPYVLAFSPGGTPGAVTVTLPDVDSSDPVDQRTVTIEVVATDANHRVIDYQHQVIVKP